jgi:hypothetical protein
LSQACIGGTTIERDVIKIEFPEIIPTPKDDPSYAFIAKYVVGTRSFGSVWVRLIGEIGTNKRTIVSGLEVDESGVYIAGSFSSGALTNLSYQSCEFGGRLPECEEGGIYYRKVTGQCWLQEAYIQAPNQVCANINTTVLARHIVRTRDFKKYTDAIRQGMFLASYNHKGVLRWHREAVGGNITVSAMALSTDKDIVLEKQTILNKGAHERQSSVQQRNTRVARRGHFVYVAGNVMQYFKEWISQERDINDQPVGRLIKELEYTNFGQMKYPLSCSQNKTLEYRGQREFKKFATGGKLVNVSATLWPPFLIFISLHEYNITDSSQEHAPLFPQVAIAKQENCKFVAHGSTGKGNDQALIYMFYESKMHLIDSILFLVLFLMVIALCLTRTVINNHRTL